MGTYQSDDKPGLLCRATAHRRTTGKDDEQASIQSRLGQTEKRISRGPVGTGRRVWAQTSCRHSHPSRSRATVPGLVERQSSTTSRDLLAPPPPRRHPYLSHYQSPRPTAERDHRSRNGRNGTPRTVVVSMTGERVELLRLEVQRRSVTPRRTERWHRRELTPPPQRGGTGRGPETGS